MFFRKLNYKNILIVLKFTEHYLEKLNEICEMEQLQINVCFENDSLLTLYYFLLILYAVIFNSILTVALDLSVLSALWLYEYEISLLFKKINLDQ